MGTSVLPYRYRVNGLVDTARTAIDNLELIGNSCATWITYDVQDGKWAVVINRAGTSVYSFDDDTIIGAIKLNGTGLVDQYNSVEVRFPHRDLNDQQDFVKIEIPDEDRLPNEPDNCLTIELPVMNEPIQAQIIGLIELKQARLDKIITFQTDYSQINLQAGNIVDVTNAVYGWTNKLFRIIRVEETDVDGAIVIEFTALEYNDNVYSLADLYRYTRTNADGILTQGALGTPTQPTVTKFEEDANPHVDISTTTPDNTDPLNQTGLVEGMEFWISLDGTNYSLLNTLRPAAALTYAFNTTVTFSYNNVTQNFYVKTRCVNSTTTGEFSTPTSVIFDPTQVTDALKEGTTGLLNSAGIPIATTLALTALLKGLDSYMNGNSNLGNAVGSQISSSGSGTLAAFTFEIDPLNNSGLGGAPWYPGGQGHYVTTNNLSFVVTTGGWYSLQHDCNFGHTSPTPPASYLAIYSIIFSGATHGAGNFVYGWNIPPDNRYFSGETSLDSTNKASPYSDLRTVAIGYLQPGTYHIELAYSATTATLGTFTGTLAAVGGNSIHWGVAAPTTQYGPAR